jgi:hypothetical protein
MCVNPELDFEAERPGLSPWGLHKTEIELTALSFRYSLL